MSANDQKIEQYRQAVEAKRSELGERPRPNYVTNQLLKLDPTDSKKLNLNLISTPAHCVEVVRQLMIQSMAHDKANDALGTDIKFEIDGYTIDDWISDIKSRLSVIQWNNKKVNLDAMDRKLAELLSEDAKKAKAIDDFAGELGLND